MKLSDPETHFPRLTYKFNPSLFVPQLCVVINPDGTLEEKYIVGYKDTRSEHLAMINKDWLDQNYSYIFHKQSFLTIHKEGKNHD